MEENDLSQARGTAVSLIFTFGGWPNPFIWGRSLIGHLGQAHYSLNGIQERDNAQEES